jgi:hypothetical protein
MLTIRRSVTCAALLAFASGCVSEESPEPEPRLIPVLNERGLITYRPETEDPGPEPPPTSSTASQETSQDETEDPQGRQDEQYARNMAEWRKSQAEQAKRDREEERAQQEQDKLRQQAARQDRQSWRNYMDQEAKRREATQRELQARAQAKGQPQKGSGRQQQIPRPQVAMPRP